MCLAIAVTFFFGYRAGRTARHVRWQDEPIQPWMSVPFVAHTHHTSSELLFQAIRELRSAIANANPPGSEGIPPSGKGPGKTP